MALTDEQLGRYARHLALKGFGLKGQKALLNGSVLIVGAGGLGAPAAMYLAAAGVGRIGIVDPDEVELTNLQRQIIHDTSDIGLPKVESAAASIRALNPDVDVRTYAQRASADNIAQLVADYDFIIDATDNFAAKFLINDACVLGEKPFCHAAAVRFEGQIMTYVPGEGPCYRCVFKEPPPPGTVPTCSQAGIIGAVVGVMGSMQALEAIKYLSGNGELYTRRLVVYDALYGEVREIPLADEPECAVCGEHPTIFEPTDYELPACSVDR